MPIARCGPACILEDAPAAQSIPIRNVLCAVDLGPQSGKTLAWAEPIWRRNSARASRCCTPCRAVRTCQRRGREELRRSAGFDAGVEAEIAVGNRRAGQADLRRRRALRADVLVIGRGSAAGVFGRLRTNAYAIIRQSPCPVVSV